LKQELLKSISSCGFEHPSEVQQQCLPNSLLGFDVLCQAKSGMGKTAVFVLTILNRLELKKEEEKKENIDNKKQSSHEVSCLVLAHTRELAYQIEKEFVRFSQNLPGTKNYGNLWRRTC